MSTKTSLTFKFDDFNLDVDERSLTFQGQPVPLTPKAFQTLTVLLRNHGRVVEKECFLSEVWADTFVEETILAQNIRTLRKTLGRFRQDKEFIVTVPRRGYQFVGDVHEISGDEEEVSAIEKRTPAQLTIEHHELHVSTGTSSDKMTVRRRRLLPENGFSPRNAVFVS